MNPPKNPAVPAPDDPNEERQPPKPKKTVRDFSDPDCPLTKPLKALPRHFVKAAMSIANALQVSFAFVAVTMLASYFAALTGRVAVQVRRDEAGWVEPLCEYVTVVLPSGSTKSPCHTVVWSPLDEIEKDRVLWFVADRRVAQKELATIEALLEGLDESGGDPSAYAELVAELEELRKRCARTGYLQLHDFTPEALAQQLATEGIIIVNPDEVDIATLMGGRWNTNASLKLYLIAFSGKSERVARKSTGVLTLDTPLATIAISTQQEPLREIVEDPQIVRRGLFARFLFCVPSDLRHLKDPRTAPPMDAEAVTLQAEILKYFTSLPENRHDPVRLVLCDGAFDTFGAAVATAAQESTEVDHPEMADWLGKFGSHAARLAGVIHMLEFTDRDGDPWDHEVSEETMRRAIDLTRAFQSQTAQVLKSAETDPAERLEQHVLSKLADIHESGDPMTFSAVWRMVKTRSSDFRTKEVLHDVLDALVARGAIIELAKRSGTPGRPGRTFAFPPRADEAPGER